MRRKTQWKDGGLFVVFRGLFVTCLYPLMLLGVARWFEGANCGAISTGWYMGVSVSEPAAGS